ncbi:MAG: ABC transporter permease [Chloroflexota bacterium]|nr:ABC transporter permease [Chloroflexota bacterium]
MADAANVGDLAAARSAARRPARRRSWWASIGTFARRRTIGFIGGAIILLMLLVALLAPIVAPYDPLETSFLDQLEPPSAEHILGTDPFGRDVFSRILYGSRTALLVGFTASIVGCSLGAALGLIGAYFGGWTDLLLERVMDVLISFPVIILAVAVVAALGTGIVNVIIAITLPIVPRVARVIRASGLTLREMQYIEAARCVGVGDFRIVFRHMLPNVVAPYLILLSAFLGQAILAEASLSFLGLGVAEPTPAWGLMLRGAGVQFLEQAPWLALAPGLAISSAVFAFNLLGDSLRDALDPRLRV